MCPGNCAVSVDVANHNVQATINFCFLVTNPLNVDTVEFTLVLRRCEWVFLDKDDCSDGFRENWTDNTSLEILSISTVQESKTKRKQESDFSPSHHTLVENRCRNRFSICTLAKKHTFQFLGGFMPEGQQYQDADILVNVPPTKEWMIVIMCIQKVWDKTAFCNIKKIKMNMWMAGKRPLV